MGYGAFMVVTNKNNTPFTTFVTNANCVYDNGDDGSNLSLFNNATVPPMGSVPSSGTQYIEAKNSGSCFFSSSTFTLKIETPDGTVVGTIAFTDGGGNWMVANNSNPDVLDVYINNSGDQARITVTIDLID